MAPPGDRTNNWVPHGSCRCSSELWAGPRDDEHGAAPRRDRPRRLNRDGVCRLQSSERPKPIDATSGANDMPTTDPHEIASNAPVASNGQVRTQPARASWRGCARDPALHVRHDVVRSRYLHARCQRVFRTGAAPRHRRTLPGLKPGHRCSTIPPHWLSEDGKRYYSKYPPGLPLIAAGAWQLGGANCGPVGQSGDGVADRAGGLPSVSAVDRCAVGASGGVASWRSTPSPTRRRCGHSPIRQWRCLSYGACTLWRNGSGITDGRMRFLPVSVLGFCPRFDMPKR